MQTADRSPGVPESVSRAAHDLNNVCASMIGFTTLAQDLADPASILGQYLAEIERAAQAAIAIAQRLHALSAEIREAAPSHKAAP